MSKRQYNFSIDEPIFKLFKEKCPARLQNKMIQKAIPNLLEQKEVDFWNIRREVRKPVSCPFRLDIESSNTLDRLVEKYAVKGKKLNRSVIMEYVLHQIATGEIEQRESKIKTYYIEKHVHEEIQKYLIGEHLNHAIETFVLDYYEEIQSETISLKSPQKIHQLSTYFDVRVSNKLKEIANDHVPKISETMVFRDMTRQLVTYLQERKIAEIKEEIKHQILILQDLGEDPKAFLKKLIDEEGL
ncbi:hypothetical protein COL27_31560 [Bacillus sp. AFS075960]|nr:hypothetical protein COL27_31560 [Bacillus sp. AFS075960]